MLGRGTLGRIPLGRFVVGASGGVTAPPFNQLSWPVVQRASYLAAILAVLPHGSPLTLTSPAVAGTPFYQTAWPVPPGPRTLQQTQPLGVFTGYMPVVAAGAPFRQTDWPNP